MVNKLAKKEISTDLLHPWF